MEQLFDVSGIVMLVLGILTGVIAYFLKRAFKQLDDHESKIEDIRLNCQSCNNRITETLIERVAKLIDEKLDAWWLKIENGLMNEGRLPPRERKKKDQ